MIPGQLLSTYNISQVVPGSTTFDTGSGNFTTPNYNTLTIEVWGAGASGGSGGTTVQSVAGGASTCTTKGMTANGGARTTVNANGAGGGVGGTASGGNTTNTTGGTGGDPSPLNTSAGTSGAGGAGASGGAGGLAGGSPSTGAAGTAPGGGGAGSNNSAGGGTFQKFAGGGGAGYSKSVYTFGVTSGFPTVAQLLAYSVGAGPAANASGGAGANGRVRFTWT